MLNMISGAEAVRDDLLKEGYKVGKQLFAVMCCPDFPQWVKDGWMLPRGWKRAFQKMYPASEYLKDREESLKEQRKVYYGNVVDGKVVAFDGVDWKIDDRVVTFPEVLLVINPLIAGLWKKSHGLDPALNARSVEEYWQMVEYPYLIGWLMYQ